MCLVRVKSEPKATRRPGRALSRVKIRACAYMPSSQFPLTCLVGELEEPLKGSRLVAARLLSNQPNLLCIIPSTYTMFACLNVATSRPVLQVKQVNLLTLGTTLLYSLSSVSTWNVEACFPSIEPNLLCILPSTYRYVACPCCKVLQVMQVNLLTISSLSLKCQLQSVWRPPGGQLKREREREGADLDHAWQAACKVAGGQLKRERESGVSRP